MGKLTFAVVIGLFSITLAFLNGVVRADPVVYEIMHYGNVGAIAWFQVVAPVDIKIGESFSVDIKFTFNEEIEASSFFIWIHGAGISWQETIASGEVGVGPKRISGTISRNVAVTATIMEAVWCDITLGFRQVRFIGTPQENFYFGSSSFGICMTRTKTYAELESEYNGLSYNYTTLKNDYDNYRNYHKYSNSEYNTLNSTYNQYVQTHKYSDSEYDNLRSNFDAQNRELGIIKTLNYVMIAIAVVFVVLIIYLARKPKMKVVR